MVGNLGTWSRIATSNILAAEISVYGILSIAEYSLTQVNCLAFATEPSTKSGVYAWLDDRLDITAIRTDVTSKYVPPHVNIFYCFGGLVFTSFIIQAATGVAMTFYYVPEVSTAFLSVKLIAESVNNGWIVRSMHRWSASMMVLFLILHVFRVYLTGGFKKPREITWVTGIVLAVITASFGVTGYSLPFDQTGYWALRIVTGVPDALPAIGGLTVSLLRGGSSIAQGTLSRFYAVHTLVLPLVITAGLLIHFLLIRKQGISGPL